jgi:hypothetical protein
MSVALDEDLCRWCEGGTGQYLCYGCQVDAEEEARAYEMVEEECDLCGGPGHTFRSCPTRDDYA